MLTPKAKISILGVGQVGSTLAYSLAMDNLGAEIVLVNRNRERARAEALDIAHGTCSETPVTVYDGDLAATANSDVVIFTLGVGPKPGETRLDILHKNVEVFKAVVPEVVRYSPNSILIVVTNPVDVLTRLTYQLSGFNRERVIGSGTVVDNARLRLFLRREYQLPMRYLHTLILGEHGDSQVIVWSQTTVAGTPLPDYLHSLGATLTAQDRERLAEQVKKVGIQEIVGAKGYTNFGIAACVKRIVKAVLLNENALLPVSVLTQGEYGLRDVCLALPCLVGASGVVNILQLQLMEEEQRKLQQSAEVLREAMQPIV